ncbi:molybdotransferase-like divisome protein Glp [Nocardiopsis coralliicola]
MKSVDQHIADILGTVRPVEPIELDLHGVRGAVLAEDVVSPVSLPRFDNSAMDGYAVRAADVAGAAEDAPVRLPVTADIPAGDSAPHTVAPGHCARIMTGAPLPAGADAVVPVEQTDGGLAEVALRRAPAPGAAVRPAGGDVQEGDTVLRRGVRVGAAEIAVLASVGRRSAVVHPRPRVVVLATGAELVEPGQPLQPGQLWESNAHMLTAAAADAGCDAYRHTLVGDDPGEVRRAIDDVLVRADLLITTGGVSMGAYDVVKEVLADRDTVHFTKIAMEPGKPQGYGTVGDDDTPVITLPGNPVSSFVSFQILVRPALLRLRGLEPEPLPSVRARLTEAVATPTERRCFRRAVLGSDAGGTTVAPVSRQSSHQLSALAYADALAVIPEGVSELPAGAEVDAVLLPRP